MNDKCLANLLNYKNAESNTALIFDGFNDENNGTLTYQDIEKITKDVRKSCVSKKFLILNLFQFKENFFDHLNQSKNLKLFALFFEEWNKNFYEILLRYFIYKYSLS